MDYIPLPVEVQTPRATFSKSPFARFWTWALLIVVLSILFDVLCVIIWKRSDETEGFCLVQIALSAMWLGMSSKWVTARLIALVAVVTLWASAFSPIGHHDAVIRGDLLVLGAFVAAAVLCLRLCGLQVIMIATRAQTSRGVVSSPAQFSIRQIFELTTAAAVLAALFKYHYFDLDDIGKIVVVPCAILLAASLLVTWAILGRRILLRLVLAGIVGIALAWWIPSWYFKSPTPLPQMLYVVLALLPFRLLGYRLRWRWAKTSPPTLSKVQ